MNIYETKIIKTEILQYKPITKFMCSTIKVNGEEVDATIEVDGNGESLIIFKSPLKEGDLLQILFTLIPIKIFTKSRYGKDALYKLYSDLAKFKFNCEYRFKLYFDHKHFHSEFSSKYNPFYSTVRIIRNDTGDLLENISDDIISEIIFDNSILVTDKIGEDIDLSEGIPLYLKNYVRYKTDLDLCYAIYLSKSGKLGSFKKKLSDLEVSNEIKLPDLEKMLSRFKELLKPNESQIDNNTGDSSASFVKGKAVEYPVSTRGVF